MLRFSKFRETVYGIYGIVDLRSIVTDQHGLNSELPDNF
jgi:hypothetical protein